MNIFQIKWEQENLSNLISTSSSKSEVLRKLGFKGTEGGHYRTLNKYIQKYGINTSHFLGQRWNFGLKFQSRPKKPLHELLTENSSASSSSLKKRLINEGIFTLICDCCGLTDWLGNPISLHLDHINGIITDNRKENLRLLCPNCHAQTPTYCRSKNNRAGGSRTHQHTESNSASSANWDTAPIEPKSCCFCQKICKSKYCSTICYHNATKYQNGGKQISRRKVTRPDKETLANNIRKNSICAVGRKYGVSDNAIRKWCKYYGIDIKSI